VIDYSRLQTIDLVRVREHENTDRSSVMDLPARVDHASQSDPRLGPSALRVRLYRGTLKSPLV